MVRRLFMLVLAGLLILLSPAGQTGTSSLQRNAEAAFAGGQFEYAYAQWKRVLEKEPKNLAAVAGLLKVEGVARDLFEESLMLQTISPEKSKENLMTVLLITDPWSELNRETRNLLGDGSSYVNHGAYRPLAELLQASAAISNVHERVAKLRKVAARYPNSPVPNYLIGQTLEVEGDTREAVREYRKAIEIRETCAICQKALGQIITSEGSAGSIGPTIP